MQTIMFQSVTAEEFMENLRMIIREELKKVFQQDQLLTKEGALKMTGASNSAFLKAINDGVVKPQLINGRKKAM